MQRKNRSSLSFAQRNRNPASTSTQSRSSARQVKVTSQGFYFGESSNGGGQAAERDLEKIEKELIRKGKKREQRIEELERGNAPSSCWNDGNNFNVPSASTSAAAIAGLLAGRQAEREDNFDDLSSQNLNPSALSISSNRKKQSAELRRLLTQRRSLKLLLEDASASPIFKSAPNNFLQSLQVDNSYPVHRGTGPICSICGYWGDILCIRCQERVCGLKCATTHNETRCDRPI